ncbi:hypothetical protein M2273_005962 [Mucilaginibacter lappiensis]
MLVVDLIYLLLFFFRKIHILRHILNKSSRENRAFVLAFHHVVIAQIDMLPVDRFFQLDPPVNLVKLSSHFSTMV